MGVRLSCTRARGPGCLAKKGRRRLEFFFGFLSFSVTIAVMDIRFCLSVGFSRHKRGVRHSMESVAFHIERAGAWQWEEGHRIQPATFLFDNDSSIYDITSYS